MINHIESDDKDTLRKLPGKYNTNPIQVSRINPGINTKKYPADKARDKLEKFDKYNQTK